MLGCSHVLRKAPSSSVCRAPAYSSVTGFHGSSSLQRTPCRARVLAHNHHTWITGHPHRITFNNAGSTTGNAGNASAGHQACNSSGTTAGAGAHTPVSGGAMLDFTGNSRFLANHLARFSTFSAVSSASSSSPSSSFQQQPQSTSAGSSSPSSSSPSSAPSPSSTKSQAPHDTVSSSGSGSSSSSAQAKFGTSATAGTSTTEDKDDDAWAINESYSGHSASGGGSSSSDGTSTDSAHRMTSHSEGDSDRRHASSPMASQDNVQEGHKHHNDDDDRHSTLRPSLSSFKDAASIEKSWRRTSDQLTPNSTSASSTSSKFSSSSSTISRPGGQSQAGNLDLSSSTLVQQMLFRDRRSQTSDDDAATKKKEDDHSSASVAAAQDLLHQSEAKVESPSLDELLDISSNNALGETAATTTATTTTTSSPSSTSSSTTTASPKKAKKDTANISNNNKKNGDSKDDEEDHISKLDIRVGIVRSVERHPDAESLYVEQVDVGDSNDDGAASPSTSSATGAAPTTRTIVSGLVKYIPKDYLEGRAVIVVRNMKPSKLRGVMSQGMLLCGMEKDSDGQVTKVELLEPAEGSQPGDKVTFEGFTDESTLPVPVLTPKRRWFEKTQIHFTVQDGIAFYKGSPFKTVRGLVRCRSINKGEIS